MGVGWLGWFSGKENKKLDDVCKDAKNELKNRLKNVPEENKRKEEEKEREETIDLDAYLGLKFDCNVSPNILLVYCLIEVINIFQDQIKGLDVRELEYDANKLKTKLQFKGANANLEIEREGDCRAIARIYLDDFRKISVGKLVDKSWQQNGEKFKSAFKEHLKKDEYQIGNDVSQNFQHKFSLCRRTIKFLGASEEVDLLLNTLDKNVLVEITRGWRGFEDFLSDWKKKLGLLLLLTTRGLIIDSFFYCLISEEQTKSQECYSIDGDNYDAVFETSTPMKKEAADATFKALLHCILDIGIKIFFVTTRSLEDASKLIVKRLKDQC